MTAPTHEDVDMGEPERVHPLQTKFDDAAEIVAGYTATSQPGAAIQLYEDILAYQGAVASECVRMYEEGGGDVADAPADTAPQCYLGCIYALSTDPADAANDEVQRVKEHAIYKLGQLYIQFGYVLYCDAVH